MPQIITCPDCGRKLKVPDDLIGKRVKCPGCGQKFVGETEKPADDDADEEAAPRSSAVASRPDAAPRSRRRDVQEEEEDRPRSRRRDDEEDDDYPVREGRRDDDRPEPSKAEIVTGWERVRFGINLVIIALWIAVGMAVTAMIGYLILAVFIGASLTSAVGGGFSGGLMAKQQAGQMAGQAAGTMTAALVGGCLLWAVLGLLILGYIACRLTGLGFCMGIASSRKTRTLKVLAIVAFCIACANLVMPMISFGAGSVLARNGGGCVLLGGQILTALLTLAEFICFLIFLRGVAVVMKKQGLAQTLLYYMIAVPVYALTLLVVPFIMAFAFGAAMFSVVSTANSHNASAAAGNAAGAGVALFVGGLACMGVEILIGLGLFIWYMVLLYQVRSAVDGWLNRN